MLSTRSGAWVFPNYIFGQPIDLYACRAFLSLPWKVGTWITETILTWVQGNPKRCVAQLWVCVCVCVCCVCVRVCDERWSVSRLWVQPPGCLLWT